MENMKKRLILQHIFNESSIGKGKEKPSEVYLKK